MIEAIIAAVLSFILFDATAPIKAPKSPLLADGIIRLHDMETNYFFCSGVVVSETLMITAAHCASSPLVRVVGADLSTHSEGVLIKQDERGDVAVYKGNFNMFKPYIMEDRPDQVIHSFAHSTIEACGYPKSGPLFCTSTIFVGPWAFFMQMKGFMWPGMSGGPVFDKVTGKVVGVNSAAYGDTILLAPLINILAD